MYSNVLECPCVLCFFVGLNGQGLLGMQEICRQCSNVCRVDGGVSVAVVVMYVG